MDFEIKVLHVKANRLKKRKGDVDMDLPEISRKIGIVHEDRLVYIEEYVLQYLELLKGQESQRGRKIFLYGKSERTSRAETYIIYAACGQEEEEEWNRRGGNAYELTGRLDLRKWKEEGDLCRCLFIGIPGEERAVDGYYIFYNADDRMKEYLSQYYEKSIYHAQNSGQKQPRQMAKKQAELVALGIKEEMDTMPLFIWIRIAAIGILVIFCAIAVITINEYDKIMDFVQTAAWTIMNL